MMLFIHKATLLIITDEKRLVKRHNRLLQSIFVGSSMMSYTKGKEILAQKYNIPFNV